MRNRVFALMTMFVLVLTVSSQAVESRSRKDGPYLSFSGTTAICNAACKGDSKDDKVSAMLALYQGSDLVVGWSKSGNEQVSFSERCPVTSGKRYTLTLTYSINNVSKPSSSVSATCP